MPEPDPAPAPSEGARRLIDRLPRCTTTQHALARHDLLVYVAGLEADVVRLTEADRLHKIRDQRWSLSRRGWVEASRKALNGDLGPLRNRVEMHDLGLVEISNGNEQFDAAQRARAEGEPHD